MNPTLTKVQSSQIAAVGHDAATNTLTVEFNNGSTYTYANVTAEMFNQLLAAESVGSFFSQNIKKNPTAYPYTKVS